MVLTIKKIKGEGLKIEHIPVKYKKRITDFLQHDLHAKIVEKNDNENFVDIDDFINSNNKLKKINESITPGKKVMLYRIKNNWTRKQLGEKLGNILEQNIYNIETGRRPIGKEMAKKLANVFDCSYKMFL